MQSPNHVFFRGLRVDGGNVPTRTKVDDMHPKQIKVSKCNFNAKPKGSTCGYHVDNFWCEHVVSQIFPRNKT